jgi:flagellar protein FlaF
MAFGFAQYERVGNQVVLPRENEARAFALVNRHLAEAASDIERIKALSRNHQLWSILLKDIALSSNALPQALKQEIAGLGLWAMGYSNLAIVRPLPIRPLINVNQAILEGLSASPLRPALPASPATGLSGALTA